MIDNEPTDTDIDNRSLPVRGSSSTKSTSSATRSPTTIFAIDELTSVFRVADTTDGSIDTEQRPVVAVVARQDSTIRRSFTTDGELSTFSEDSETIISSTTSSSSYSEDDDDEEEVARFAIRRRRSPLSIFRQSISGTKRRSCEFEQDEEDDDIDQLVHRASVSGTSNKRPMLCHASPISDSDDDEPGHEFNSLSSSYSPLSQAGEDDSSSPFDVGSRSPFKRPCRQEEENHELSSSATTLTLPLSPYSSFFAEASSPAAANANTTTATTATTFSLMPNHLQHPLSFFESTTSTTAARGVGSSALAFPIFRANAIKEN